MVTMALMSMAAAMRTAAMQMVSVTMRSSFSRSGCGVLNMVSLVSISRMILFMAFTTSTGYLPTLVSALNITASA